MRQTTWQQVFIPAARACYPGCARVRSMPGDPPFPLDEPPELVQSLLFFTSNSLSMLAVGRPLVPVNILVESRQPAIQADPYSDPVDPGALALRQLLAMEAWENLDLNLSDDILEMGPVMTEWLDLVQALPEHTPLPAEVGVPFVVAKQLARAEILSQAQSAVLADVMGAPPVVPENDIAKPGVMP